MCYTGRMMLGRLAYLVGGILFCGVGARATSLLIPTKYPTTSQDYSFVQRVENKAEGYEPYAGMSAYKIMEFESMEDYAQRAIEAELKAAGIDVCDGCDENGVPPAQDGSTVVMLSQPPAQSPQPNVPMDTVPPETVPPQSPSTGAISGYCSRRNPNIPSGQTIPFGLPVNMADLSSGISSRAQSIARNTNNGLFCSPYGCGRGRPHEGVDIGCDADFYQMPIYATADGVVEYIVSAGNNASAGNYIRINHGNGWISQYMHLDKMFVSKGQRVDAGCLIGLMGHTGGNRDQKVRGMSIDLTHLHYEIIYSGRASYVQAPNGKQISIVRGDKNLGPCGDFKSKILPNDIMVYK